MHPEATSAEWMRKQASSHGSSKGYQGFEAQGGAFPCWGRLDAYRGAQNRATSYGYMAIAGGGMETGC